MKLICTLCLFAIFFEGLTAQTVIWKDSFEDTGDPSSGTRTPSVNNSSGGPPATRYFWRCGTSNISLVNVYTNINGSKFWAGEDHRLSPISQSAHQTVTWSGINISSQTSLQFKGLFACGPANFDIPPASPSTDYIIVSYRKDGGTWVDGLRLFPYNPTIATFLSIENTGDSVGEGVTLLNSANFTEFSFNIPGTGTTLDLMLKAHSNGTSEEWAADNFRILSTSTLPVQLTYFNGRNENGKNLLNWSTATEQMSDYFVLEKSRDGVNFTEIGKIPAAGNSQLRKDYSYVDEKPISITFYRLKQVDIDTKFEYSNTIAIKDKSPQQLQIYPNPAKETLYIQSALFSLPQSELTVTDKIGRKWPMKVTGNGSLRQLDIRSLPVGMYFLNLTATEKIQTGSFIKN